MRTRVVVLFVLALGLVAAPGATALERQVPPSLVFVRNGDLYRMTIEGSETTRITATTATESDPTVSPDRLSLAYARGGYASTIWTVSIDGARPRRITNTPTDADPAWSADGWIYFIRWFANSFGEDCGSIFRVRPDGTRLSRVTKGAPNHMTPAVSPDGALLAFADVDLCAGGAAKLALGVVDTKGRPAPGSARLKRVTRGSSWQPTWSPDGKQIAFSWLGSSAELFVIDANGTKLRRVGRDLGRGELGEPAWSPDGEWIAFAAEIGTSYDLFVIRPDGTGLRRLTRTKMDEHAPAWLLRT
jgi:TolB protein